MSADPVAVPRTRTGFQPPAEFDDYVIVRPLGAGAMGEVYLAEDAVLARPIAIKFLGVEPDPSARQRFLMEARAAARIQHPNVVSIYRVAELGDRPYIVSELVRGTQLAELERPVPWTRALTLAIDLARGLAAAHRRGVVHCDIKPGNVMVTEDGMAKLVDFGLAQVVRDGNETTGTMIGTPDYMAPEIWGGSPPTRRSDVYALGAVLYELISGAVPFAGTEVHDLAARTRDHAAPALDTEPRVAALVARCLARDPEQRFPSGEELREALEQLHAARDHGLRIEGNPYRGLRAFESSHRGVFFGRGLEIGALVERLRTESVVVVAGESGVGKSSLCRAGVVPAILDGALGGGRTFRAITVVPGRRPLQAIAAALDDPGLAARVLAEPELLARELHRRAGTDGLVFFVDQMEELVTVGDPAEVAAFDAALARISEGVAGVRLMTTARSDFIARLVALPRFGAELSRCLFFVRSLPPEQIRDVITGPASATGVTFESDQMIGELVDATAQAGSGGLPLLSFALAELWEARDRARGVITEATLETLGGVAGALARHADTVIAGMPAVDRAEARRVLLRLVTSVGTRVRRTEAELTTSAATKSALAALVKGRLLVVHDGDAGPLYELAHEVLVRGWGTLREWLEADAEDRARRERLAEACAEWQRLGRRGDATWRGPRLLEAQGLEAASLTPVERDFIAASARAVQRRIWIRRIAIAAAITAAVSVYVVQRAVAAHRLAAKVETAVATARDELAGADAEDQHQRAATTTAFAKFDTGDHDAGETAWKAAVTGRSTAARGLRTASRDIEAALALDPGRTDVRDMLGDVTLARATLADLLRDFEMRDELLGRLASYDADGSRRKAWAAPGSVAIHAPANATIALDGKPIGTGDASVELAVGSYAIDVDAPGLAHVHEPIRIERGQTLDFRFAPPAAASVPADYVYIPAGSYLYGSSADDGTRTAFFTAEPLHKKTTAAFLVARHEVTFADWLIYVDAQPPAQRAKLLPNVPGKNGEGVVVEATPKGYELVLQTAGHTYRAKWGEPVRYTDRTRRAVQDWSKMPVLGISGNDSAAYAQWLDRSGRIPGARMCTEGEWERAARGTDGRDDPTGKGLGDDDANIDVTYAREHMGPDEIGSHPSSLSPYGLFDVIGNGYEFTRAEHGTAYVARGGSYYYDRKTANIANRAEVPMNLREPSMGVRLCATPAH